MVDRLSGAERRQERALLYALQKNPVVGEILEQGKVKISVEYKLGLLNWGIVKPRDGLSSAELFGIKDCVGVKVTREAEQAGDQRIKIAERLGVGPRQVAVLTVRELEDWLQFYHQIGDSGLWCSLGRKVLDFSGLAKMTETGSERLRTQAINWMEDAEGFFRRHGVVGHRENGLIDWELVDENGQNRAVPIGLIREARLDGQVLEEKVGREVELVSRMVVVRPGESKRQAYERASKAESMCGQRAAVLSWGQLSLWNKLGVEPLQTCLPDTGVEMRELLDFLYFGESNTKPGLLAAQPWGLSLPRAYPDLAVDVVFEQKKSDGSRKWPLLNNVLGMDLRRLKIGKRGVVPLSSVGGIVVFPDDVPVERMHEITKNKSLALNRSHWGPDVYLLYLTPWLFEEWKKSKTMFMEEEQAAEVFGDDLRRQREYGAMTIKSHTGTELRLMRSKPQVGDARLILTERGEGQEIMTVLDLGSAYGGIPLADKGLPERTGTVAGLRGSFLSGEIPMVPGLYYYGYLLATIGGWPAVFDSGCRTPAVEYLRAEAVRNVPREDLIDYLGAEAAAALLALAKGAVKQWYGESRKVVENVMVTHSHVDHAGAIPLTGAPLELWWRVAGRLMSRTSSAATWPGKIAYWTQVHEGRVEGNGYPKEWRQINRTYHEGDEVTLSRNLSVQVFPVDHSVDCTAFGIRTSEGEALYMTDFKMGPQTESSLTAMEKRRWDVILMEGTNPKGVLKGSTLAGEERMTENFARVMREGKGLVVIMSPAYDLGQLECIHKAAEESKRTLVLGYQIADEAEHLAAEEAAAPLDAYGRGLVWLPGIGEDVALFDRPLLQKKSWQTGLLDRAKMGKLGVVTVDRLQKIAGESVVVVSPYDSFRKSFGGGNFPGINVIWSAPFPYGGADKQRVGGIKYATEQLMHGKFWAGFDVFGMNGGRVEVSRDPERVFHTSGHATFEQNASVLERLLANNQSGEKTPRVYVVHGSNPLRYAADMAGVLKSKGIKVEMIGRMDHYDPNDPINKPGQVIKI